MTRVVAGIDAGATSTRCAVVDDTGRLLGAGEAAGANQNSSAAPGETLRAALQAAGANRLDVLVLGAAGAGVAGAGRAGRLVHQAADAAGISVERQVICSDIEVAFAAGSAQGDGTVVIAGTGAVAAAVADFAVRRRIDGTGYLLGDRGSAVWLGLHALRAAIGAIDGSGPSTALRELVLERVDRSLGDDVQSVVAAAYGGAPAEIGGFAPLVERAARDGDEVARDLVGRAVTALVESACATGGCAPVVVAGAVAAGVGLVGDALRARLLAEFGVEPVRATDTRRGAVALALRALPDPPLDVASRLITEGLG